MRSETPTRGIERFNCKEMKPVQRPRRALDIELLQSLAHNQENELVPTPQHAQGLQLLLSPRYEQGIQQFQTSANIQNVQLTSPLQHAQGLQLVLSPGHGPGHVQEKHMFPSSIYTQDVELIPKSQHAQGLQLPSREQDKQLSHSTTHMQGVQTTSPHQHAQGLQLVLSSGHSREKLAFPSSIYTQEVQFISSPQHAQGLQLVLSPSPEHEKQRFQSSAHVQEVPLLSPHQHAQELQLVPSPRHFQEQQRFQSLGCLQDLHLTTSPQQAQGLQLVQSPRQMQEIQVIPSSMYTQEVPSPQHLQGLLLVLSQSPEKQIFQPSEYMQDVELIPSPHYGKGSSQFLDWPEHMQDKDTIHTTAHHQETRAHVKEIKEYLIAHKSWQVPDSVLYEEPIAEVKCDLERFLEEISDAADEAEEIQNINTSSVEDGVEVKVRKRGGRRHKGHFMKRPMALTEVIEELKNIDLRENALRCLSGHLVERREQDPDFYRQAGFYIFHSCSTVVILIQEILFVYERLSADDLNIRRSKRMANVLCLLQCVATNSETRLPFVKARIPNYLIPFIISQYTEEVYENLRALSLSVFSILCQTLDKEIIQWALQNDIIEVCFYALDVGSELSKVLAMTVMDCILRVDEGLSAICEPSCDLLPRFIKLCEDLVSVLAYIQGFSPRLLFLVVRSFILLCQNCRALELLKDQMPAQLHDTTFRDVKMEYPLFAYLRHLLLLCTGKANGHLPSVDCSPTTPASSSHDSKNWEDENSSASGQATSESVRVYVTPMRPVNLNKQDWSSSARPTLLT